MFVNLRARKKCVKHNNAKLISKNFIQPSLQNQKLPYLTDG